MINPEISSMDEQLRKLHERLPVGSMFRVFDKIGKKYVFCKIAENIQYEEKTASWVVLVEVAGKMKKAKFDKKSGYWKLRK